MAEFAATFGRELWHVACDMSVFLLLGFLLAGVLAVAVPAAIVERHLGRGGILSIIKATVMGIPLPLCSCGVIPVAASLRKHGAGRGAAAAFLVATPQTGVDSVLVTISLLGPLFAAMRVACALVSGFAVGLAAQWLSRGGAAEQPEPSCTDACCVARPGQGKLSRALTFGLVSLPGEIGFSLVVGLIAAAAISALIPDNFLAGLAGGGILSMLLMMAAGIPVYVCATASVPIAAALMAKGVSPGAALVFLMTGPVTNLAAFSGVWKILGRRTAAVYLAAVAFTAVGSGLLMDAVLPGGVVARATEAGELLPGWVEIAGVFVLAAVLSWSGVAAAFGRRAAGAAAGAAAPACGAGCTGHDQGHAEGGHHEHGEGCDDCGHDHTEEGGGG